MNSKEFYNLHAQEYDTIYYSVENKDNKAIAQNITNIVQKYNIQSIIEFGCGNGYWLLLSARLGVQRIMGIDHSASMLSVAKNKLINHPFVEVIESDITQPMQFQRLFDMALISFVISIIDINELDCVFNNISQSVVDKGILFLVENKQPLSTTNDVYSMTIREHWGGMKKDMTYNLYDSKFLCRKLEDFGFQVLASIDISSDIYVLVAKKNLAYNFNR